MFYKKILRPLLFSCDSEEIHHALMGLLENFGPTPWFQSLLPHLTRVETKPVHLFGLTFRNPVGLAAGFDKNATAIPAWQALGFGFVEVGTITALRQPGNDKPRLFRLIPEEALINRMGFNNEGAEIIAVRLRELRSDFPSLAIPVGINLGKSKITPLEAAHEDYLQSFRELRNVGDYFVINVSSPNTPGLRQLQDKDHLRLILSTLRSENAEGKPILVKLAPDLSPGQIDEALEVILSEKAAGVIATNTTISRDTLPLPTSPLAREAGGLSGKPLRERSTEVISHIARVTSGKLPIIGAGGIFTAEDAAEKLGAGASLVQIYTGFVYEGPFAVRNILQGLNRTIPTRVGNLE
ncbi:MAG: quinone-dependent dihydroorotate dehydrogenase [Verrucomicrobiae bacterium]|nr:quinone-dependent dihydroorotate dehydrogenase [Verrucomicrobiae bacterium]